MRRALGISLAAHLALIGSVYAGSRERPGGLPARVYTVDVVSLPGSARGGGGAARSTTAPAPKVPSRPATPASTSSRSGVKVDKAPSRETAAPRGTKRPKAPAGQAAPDTLAPGGGGLGVGHGTGGVRVEGEPFPYPDYLRDLVARIEAKWEPPSAAAGSRQATVYFTVDASGALVAWVVEASSGQLSFDRTALEAVVEAGPFPALPAGFAGTRLSVHLDFAE